MAPRAGTNHQSPQSPIVRALSPYRVHDMAMNEREVQPVETAERPFTIEDLHSFFDPTSGSVGQLRGRGRTESIVGSAQAGIQHRRDAGATPTG